MNSLYAKSLKVFMQELPTTIKGCKNYSLPNAIAKTCKQSLATHRTKIFCGEDIKRVINDISSCRKTFCRD